MQRDMDTLTPLDARNSLLLDRKDPELGPNGETTFSMASTVEKRQQPTKARAPSLDPYDKAAAATYDSYYRHKISASNGSNSSNGSYRALTQDTAVYGHQRNQSRENLVSGAAPVGQDLERQPTLPNVEGGGWNSAYDNGDGTGYSGYRQYRGF